MIQKKIFISITLLSWSINAQIQPEHLKKNFNFVNLGFSTGKTIPSISIFPEVENQTGFDISLGNTNYNNDSWASVLNYPKSGIILSYADFGNKEKVGYGISVMPFLDFGLFNTYSNRFRVQVALGANYSNIIYDPITNPGNYGISTHFTWAFKTFFHYSVLDKEKYAIKLGAGFTHFSNGHTRLPNHGLNSVLFSVRTDYNFNKKESIVPQLKDTSSSSEFQNYFSARFGLGQKVLSRDYNSRKDVYTTSFSAGKIKNRILKYGFGLHYRFYEDYYDFIEEDGALLNSNYPELKNNPFHNSTMLGMFGNFELLINHFSLETELGINFYKPAYKMDYYFNNVTYKSGTSVPKEFGVKAKAKQIISSRLGFRYYVLNTKKAPQHNLFLAANINANLGQADFSEVSMGYVYCTKPQKK